MTKKASAPTELFNEKQETIFNTALSTAADNFTKTLLEIDGWKKKRTETEKILIDEMHKAKLGCINLSNNRQLRIAVTSQKEKVVMKELKAKKTKMPRRL